MNLGKVADGAVKSIFGQGDELLFLYFKIQKVNVFFFNSDFVSAKCFFNIGFSFGWLCSLLHLSDE